MGITPEEKKLFDLTMKLERLLNLDEETTATIIVLINTPKKRLKLEEWVNSITKGEIIQTDEFELLNMVTEISQYQ